MTLLFLLSHQRSGSHLLKRTLNCHNDQLDQTGAVGTRYLALPEVLSPGVVNEYYDFREWLFEPFFQNLVTSDALEWGNPSGISRAMHLYFDRLEELAADQVVLVDIKLNQLHFANGWFHETEARPSLLFHIIQKGKIVFLRRRNLLRASISGLLAGLTGVWHVEATQSVPHGRNKRLQIPAGQFLNYLHELDAGISTVERWLNDWSPFVLKVDYEDLYNEDRQECNSFTFDRIARYCGLTVGIEWRAAMQKLGTYALCDVIENYSELRARLVQTKFSSMLDDHRLEFSHRKAA